jgi:hypothetical protein
VATTIGNLIEYLSTIDKDTPVLYQFILPEHTDYSPEEFEARVDEVENSNFADEMSEVMNAWLDDVDETSFMSS